MAGINAMPKRHIAPDTNVLLDYADGHKRVTRCFDVIRSKLPDAPIFVLPTVIDELNHHSKKPDPDGGCSEIRRKQFKDIY